MLFRCFFCLFLYVSSLINVGARLVRELFATSWALSTSSFLHDTASSISLDLILRMASGEYLHSKEKQCNTQSIYFIQLIPHEAFDLNNNSSSSSRSTSLSKRPTLGPSSETSIPSTAVDRKNRFSNDLHVKQQIPSTIYPHRGLQRKSLHSVGVGKLQCTFIRHNFI